MQRHITRKSRRVGVWKEERNSVAHSSCLLHTCQKKTKKMTDNVIFPKYSEHLHCTIWFLPSMEETIISPNFFWTFQDCFISSSPQLLCLYTYTRKPLSSFQTMQALIVPWEKGERNWGKYSEGSERALLHTDNTRFPSLFLHLPCFPPYKSRGDDYVAFFPSLPFPPPWQYIEKRERIEKNITTVWYWKIEEK